MRKQTLALVALAFPIALVSFATSGILSILCGLVVVGLGISAGIVQSAVLVDENYHLIPDSDVPGWQATQAPHFVSETSLSEY